MAAPCCNSAHARPVPCLPTAHCQQQGCIQLWVAGIELMLCLQTACPASNPGDVRARACLAAAGPELEAGGVDYLCTTPQELLNTVDNVLMLYDTSRAKGTMAGEAASLMSPEASSCLLAAGPACPLGRWLIGPPALGGRGGEEQCQTDSEHHGQKFEIHWCEALCSAATPACRSLNGCVSCKSRYGGSICKQVAVDKLPEPSFCLGKFALIGYKFFLMICNKEEV